MARRTSRRGVMSMTPWPVMKPVEEMTVAEYLGNVPELEYERARADAAIERLRLAVEALKCVQRASAGWPSLVREALEAIGEIP
jgi:hypothetical protein